MLKNNFSSTTIYFNQLNNLFCAKLCLFIYAVNNFIITRFGLVNNFFHWKGKFKSKSISRNFYGSLGLLSIIYLLRFHSWKLCVSIRFISHFWSKINKLCWGQGGLQEECLTVHFQKNLIAGWKAFVPESRQFTVPDLVAFPY